MKHSILFLAFLFFSIATIQAQAPQAFQYQAIARSNTGLPILNQTISIRISVISGSQTGAILYVETHSPTTNPFGLFNLKIGQGTVANGTFNSINWGSNQHFLKVEMDETGGTAYQDMGTVSLISVPYALHAATVDNADDADADPTNELQTLSVSGSMLSISGGNSVSLSGGGTLDDAYDFGGVGAGRTINADAGEVSITTGSLNSTAFRVENTNTGVGLISSTTNPSNLFSPIQAETNSNANTVAGVLGNTSGTAWGVAGQAALNSNAEAAVYGSNLRTVGGHGVLGIGFNGTVGTTGQSTGFGVYGDNLDNVAPLGNGVGVGGKGFYGVLGEDRYLGAQNGAYGVYSNGTLGATGTKTFRIDHPTDPENKFLRHFSLESNEVLNVYRGTATFDANGNAMINLPDYFNTINRNVSYQLTPIGAYMPLCIQEKVNDNNQFVVSGGLAGKEVSWAVYAERNDLYMQKNPQQRAVEIKKRDHEKGHYLIPSLYGAEKDKGIFNQQPKVSKQKPMNVMD